jgi:5-methylcytosine-specific restriction protein A
MPTYLLTWNPKHWGWDDFDKEYIKTRERGFYDSRWSCGVTKRIKEGDRVFLLRQGREPKGILAAGHVTVGPFREAHFTDLGKTALYIRARFDTLLRPETEILPRRSLDIGHLKDVNWGTQASGMSIPPPAAEELEFLWRSHLDSLGLHNFSSADEVTGEKYSEGSIKRITVNAYERDPRARAACIAHHGTNCCVCGFSFGSTFGDVGEGFIHVHHLRQLSDIGEEYSVDPITDLRPVCPNCHAVIHRRLPPYTIEEIKELRRGK